MNNIIQFFKAMTYLIVGDKALASDATGRKKSANHIMKIQKYSHDQWQKIRQRK